MLTEKPLIVKVARGVADRIRRVFGDTLEIIAQYNTADERAYNNDRNDQRNYTLIHTTTSLNDLIPLCYLNYTTNIYLIVDFLTAAFCLDDASASV